MAKVPSALLISYEKAMQNRADTVQAINQFCQLNASVELLQDAESFMDPFPIEYLDCSRINKAQGRFGGLDGNRI